jgi:hypothetical protein
MLDRHVCAKLDSDGCKQMVQIFVQIFVLAGLPKKREMKRKNTLAASVLPKMERKTRTNNSKRAVKK